MLEEKYIEYYDKDILLEGYYADCNAANKKPAILVAHDWSGRNAFAMQKAKALAELGYVGFALDMYGKGILGQSKEEKSSLIQPFMQDRQALQQRILAAFEAVKQLPGVDATRIAAIGFCFGGLCVLDLARSGADVRGVVSFHGLLQAPHDVAQPPIKAAILALHGFLDPMATPEQAVAFGNEMTQREADWQLHAYGNTLHAFTNPEANDPSFGTVYNKKSDHRSWQAMQSFLAERCSHLRN
ncbi:MAG TPA: dienelactone hydrolase family protein [Gammaproteobacteria bacterium]|jgi:dienelactone hydrolase|nr:dienelactone hydrolase family protein [Gammaproteobacteria bacterium]